MSFTITGPGGPTPAGAVSGSGTPAPAVAAIGSGRWVAVWQADNTVEARVFEADGAPVDASFLVAADALAGVARVAALASGGFVVTWAADPAGGSETDIFVRRYDVDGDPIDFAPVPVVEHNPDDGAPKGNVTPDVAGLTNGGFVVTWTGASFGTDPDIYMRPFNSAGAPGTQAFVPETLFSQFEVTPRVVALGDGWAIVSTEGSATGRDIWLRRFGSNGAMIDPTPVKITLLNLAADTLPAVATLSGGALVVTWISDVGGKHIAQRLVDAEGNMIGSELAVDSGIATSLSAPAVAALADGGWIATFVMATASDPAAVYQRRYLADGTPVDAAEVRVADSISGAGPAVALVGAETVLTAWAVQNGSDIDVLQRLLRLAMTTGVDVADGTAGAETLAIAPGTLSAGDTVDGKGGIDTLALSAAGTIDLRLPASLTGIEALVGSPGADIVVTDAARLVPFASFDGGAGHDTLVLAGGGTFSFAGKSLLGFERIAVEGAAPAVVFLSPGADVAEGGAGGDTLFGADGNDALSGGAGNDALVGGPGDDSLSGGDGADALSGEAGNDVLAGSSGNDILSGADGADALSGEPGNDRLAGDLGNDRLSGGLGVDTLKGGVGNDRLAGGLGKDALTGGKGKDVFVFDTKLSSANLDKVLDFNVRDDSFQLDNAVFRKLGKGTPAKPVKLGADAFFKGKAAEDKEDRILYDKASGALFYDADGIGAAKAVKVAILKKGLALTHSDFFVI